ncbi:MAG TPA: hypothetical protein DCG47_12360 [Spirochaetaceae bacterium]|jgi:hypothetical protein|nr:hypothetical protein [Spirochaetaceae bacterium]
MMPARGERLRAWHAALCVRVQALKPYKGRIAATLLGALAGGRLFIFGAAVGCLLGAMLDALAARPPEGEAAPPRPSAAEEARIQAGQERARLYALFGLEPGAPRSELAKAYKRRSRLCHPDARGGSAEEFLALKKAYDRIRELGAQE